MRHRRVGNYIVAAAVGILSAALLAGCQQTVSNEEQAASVLALAYEEIPELGDADTVIYDDVTPEFVLTYAENQNEDYPTTQAGYRFAQLVNIRSEGRIQILVYADAALGDESSMVARLRTGGIDFARVGLVVIRDNNEESTALMMPYVYRDSDHMWAVLNSEIGDRVMAGFQNCGFTPLSWFDAGVRNLYFRIPIHNLDEMQGLRIRVQPFALMEDMIREFGAVPVPTEYEEVYSSLELENVDGAENNWSSYDAMAHNEIARYYMTDEHMRIPEMQLISDVTASQLSAADMAIIRESAADAADYERYLWSIYEQEAEERATREGTTVMTLSAEEKQAFIDAVAPLYDKYCGDYMDLIQEIREMD